MLPDYKRHDPRGWGGDPKRGAAMGRGTYDRDRVDYDGVLHVRKVFLDTGGYDINGTYFGTGKPLYWVASPDTEIDWCLWADNRLEAIREALKAHPKATIAEPTDVDVEALFQAYVEYALAFSEDAKGVSLDHEYSSGDLDPESEKLLREKLGTYATEHALTIGDDAEEWGHRLWETWSREVYVKRKKVFIR